MGTVYQPTNLAGEKGKRATSEVFYTDAMVCEDSTMHNRPFCRSLIAYEKYYSEIQRSASEAVEECMDIPEEVLAITAEAFNALSIEIKTRWCPTRR